ncbi:hypothetical protein EVAR_64052_1 [Eumeta japonica]|uniref:Uncharacterized protein n=1 Tax=Eumeta variegata TaxID=151549 RepID=A0A4C1ZX74_EUMVA|nr:hypothetical protein EVAR_64052_1 [Eumeta japonica]
MQERLLHRNYPDTKPITNTIQLNVEQIQMFSFSAPVIARPHPFSTVSVDFAPTSRAASSGNSGAGGPPPPAPAHRRVRRVTESNLESQNFCPSEAAKRATCTE